MNNIQIIQGISDFEVSALLTRYLSEPSDLTFRNLSKKLIDNGKLTDIIYDLCLSKSWQASSINHLIRCLFLNGRFIETIYYCDKYRKKFRMNKEIARIYAMSKIESGLLQSEENLLKECVDFNDEKHQELTLRIAYCLRIGMLERAHDLSVELLFIPDCFEHGYVAIIETAIRVKDCDLLSTALNDAKIKDINFTFGKVKEQKIKHLLLVEIINQLTKIL